MVGHIILPVESYSIMEERTRLQEEVSDKLT
jgi:hypothetical protein